MYNCKENVTFGESATNTVRGNTINCQNILLNGKVIGILEEVSWYDVTKPMSVTFVMPLPDDLPESLKCHPRLVEGEWNELHFPTLQELVDFVGTETGSHMARWYREALEEA